MEDIDKMIQQSIKKAFQGAPISEPKEKNSAMRQTMQSMKETKKVKENIKVEFQEFTNSPENRSIKNLTEIKHAKKNENDLNPYMNPY